jgi:hypothetical protein
LGDLDDVGKTTSETGQAMMAYLGDDDDNDERSHRVRSWMAPEQY